MKKTLLAAAVAALAVSSVASAATIYDKDGTAVDVYGRVQAVYYSQDSGNNAQSAANDGNLNASSRLGFDFRSSLTDWATAVAKVEWQNADDDANNDFNSRYVWVGVDFGEFGLVKAGKFEEAIKYVVETTDIFDDFGCMAQLGNDDRRDGMLGYYVSVQNFDFNATFGTPKDGQQVDGAFLGETLNPTHDATGTGNAYGEEKVDIQYAWSMSFGYTTPEILFGPMSFRAGFGGAEMQPRDNGEGSRAAYYKDNVYDDYSNWALSATWGTLDEGLYLSASYNERDFNFINPTDLVTGFTVDGYKIRGLEGVAAWTFANGVSVRGGIEWMNIESDGGADVEVDAVTAPLYVLYQINPNFRVWAEGRVNIDTHDGKNYSFRSVTHRTYNAMDNVFSVGARYTF